MQRFTQFVTVLRTSVFSFPILLFSLNSDASMLSFTDEASYLAAISGHSISGVQDFESLTPGTALPDGASIDHPIDYPIPQSITFNHSIDGGLLDMTVSDVFSTTSGSNYLGVNDGGNEVFISGDGFSIISSSSLNSIGLWIIASPGDVFPADFTLSIDGTSHEISNTGTPNQQLGQAGDEGDAFFLGLVSSDDFTTINLSSFCLDDGNGGCEYLFDFVIDDIYMSQNITVTNLPGGQEVPEPSSIAFVILGVLGLARRRLGKNY